MELLDTDAEARRVQLEIYRSMSGAERVEIAVAMAEEVRSIALAGINARMPGLDAKALQVELLRVFHGDEVVESMGLE